MKVLVKIKDDKLTFLNKKKLNAEYKNMLNTNVISNDELVFSDQYIKENYKIIATFLSELIKTYSLTTLSFQNMEVATLFFPIINKIKYISIINFESDEILPYKFCEKLLKCQNIKFVSAQYIPPYMFEMLDKYDIIPESRNEILFTSNFMELNGLSTYSSLFYKYTVYLDFPLSSEDLNDFKTFCKINRHLKNVHINIPNKFNLEEIIFLLKEYKHKNVKIIIHGDVHDIEVIEYLKKNNKAIKKRYKITLKLKYSDKYIQNNIAKETNNNILRMCGLLMLAIALTSSALIFYDNYKSMKQVAKIQEEIQDVIIATDPEEIITQIESENGNKVVVNDYIASLTSINPEAVGWLKVNNTNIDYAILQTDDNDYYLNYNIYNEKDPNGWLFLDYENHPDQVDDNTIIYGHNRFVNGVMFGTLNKALYRDWYTNPENQIIRYDTMYGSYKYKIFSIYTVVTTTDYLTTNFLSDEAKKNFLNTIKSRSIYDFGVELDLDSKVITLSTCQSDTTRLVVHGVLIEE
ncbi:MAG: class B sortase [Firmicutes bacterium]|nr:class B sortase [Bacillota bacterium]